MSISPSLLPHVSISSFSCRVAAAGIGQEIGRRPRVRRRGEPADPGEAIEVREPEVQRLPAAHRQPGEGAALPVRLHRVARFDRRDHVVEQVALEDRERRRAGEGVAPGAVVLLRAPVREHGDERHHLAVRDQVVEQLGGMGEADPLGLVAADAVQQIDDGVLLVLAVARRRVDVHLAPRADRLRVVLDQLQRAVRNRFAALEDRVRRFGEGGHVVGLEDDGPRHARPCRLRWTCRGGCRLVRSLAGSRARRRGRSLGSRERRYRHDETQSDHVVASQ